MGLYISIDKSFQFFWLWICVTSRVQTKKKMQVKKLKVRDISIRMKEQVKIFTCSTLNIQTLNKHSTIFTSDTYQRLIEISCRKMTAQKNRKKKETFKNYSNWFSSLCSWCWKMEMKDVERKWRWGRMHTTLLKTKHRNYNKKWIKSKEKHCKMIMKNNKNCINIEIKMKSNPKMKDQKGIPIFFVLCAFFTHLNAYNYLVVHFIQQPRSHLEILCVSLFYFFPPIIWIILSNIFQQLNRFSFFYSSFSE